MSQTAFAFGVSPLRLSINAAEEMGVVRVSNPRDVGVTYSVRAFKWLSSSNIADLVPTEDLLVVPPVFEIDAGEEQVIRVATRSWDEAAPERAYRLVIDEVASEIESSKSVDFNFSVTMPVFVSPQTAKAEPTWTLERDQDVGAKLVVENHGTAHLAFDDLQLGPNLAAEPLFNIPVGGPIFAGEQRSWPMDIPLSSLKEPLHLIAGTDHGPIEAMVVLPDS